MTRRQLLFGLAAAAAWVAAALLSFRAGLLPQSPLYDGLAPPPPYRWAKPPPEAPTKEPPLPGKGTVELAPEGNRPGSISTGDGQATVVLAAGAIPAAEGAASVEVTISPLDPAKLPPPPEGLRVDGNGYRFSAAYSPGSAVPSATAQVILRYPTDATVVLARKGKGWTRLETTATGGSLQVFANASIPGAFAAAGPPIPRRGIPWWGWAAGVGAAALAAGAGFERRRKERKRRRSRASRRRKTRARRR